MAGVGQFFVLLMFFGNPMELKEYSIREGLSECLSTKRTIEGNVRGGRSTEYTGSMRLACKQLKVEHDANYNIKKLVDVNPSDIKPF